MFNVGIIGLGYWGKNILRNFNDHPECWVSLLCDSNPESFGKLPDYSKEITKVSDYNRVLDNPSVDIVAIVTPPETHYKIAKKSLLKGKHIFVEKPFTVKSEHAAELVKLAAECNLKIVVDHTFLYTTHIQYLKKMIEKRMDFGQLLYVDSVRINLGRFQTNVNVLYDLATHDISIINYIIGTPPKEVKCTLHKNYEDFQDNIAYLTLYYPENIIANIHVNWLSPVKVRKMIFSGTNKMCVYDDLEQTNKVTVYRSGIETLLDSEKNKDVLTGYRIGDPQVPQLPNVEALAGIVEDMVRAIKENREPLSNGSMGLEVVQTLESCQEAGNQMKKDEQ